MKVYWLDFSLHFRSCCLLRVCRRFGPKLASHYKPVENEVKFGLSEPYKSSIKKRIIVSRSVRSMFGQTNIRPVKNGLKSQQPQEQRYPFLPVCAVFRVSTQWCGCQCYQCVQYFVCPHNGVAASVWDFLTCAQMLMHAITHGGCTDTVRVSALKVAPGRKLPWGTGTSGVLTTLAWLVPHETAVVSARSVYTPQPCTMSLHANSCQYVSGGSYCVPSKRDIGDFNQSRVRMAVPDGWVCTVYSLRFVSMRAEHSKPGVLLVLLQVLLLLLLLLLPLPLSLALFWFLPRSEGRWRWWCCCCSSVAVTLLVVVLQVVVMVRRRRARMRMWSSSFPLSSSSSL